MHFTDALTVCIVGIAFAAQADGPLIHQVTADSGVVTVYERLTLTIDCEAEFENPFDSREVRVDAHITEADGREWTAPGFWYKPYNRRLENGSEVLEPAGSPEWQVRLSFPRAGLHTVVVQVTNATGETTASPLTVEVVEADVPGMIRRHPDDHRYFVTDRGETYFPVGANVCWGGPRGTFNYDEWLQHYNEAGCNFFRVWLNPEWFTFAMNSVETGYDRIDLGNAWRFDYVLEVAESYGMGALVCIDSFNILRSTERLYGNWENTPYIETNGGPLTEPIEYFTDSEMRRAYKDRLRYLVARYGYSSSVFSWQFWNEVDIIDDYDSEIVAAWHADMAEALAEYDPWDHLISTSHANPMGDPNVDLLPQLDFVVSHSYGGEDVVATLGRIREEKAAAQDRPHFQGEFGIESGEGTRELDPLGVHIHNALFSSPGQMHAGAPMSWWWDSYIHPLDLYEIYRVFNDWLDDYDFVAENTRPICVDLYLPDEAKKLRMPGDDRFEPARGSWSEAPFNQPVTVRINQDGEIDHPESLARVFHGVNNHPLLHNPVTFELDVPEDTMFGVYIDGVSGHGGAGLRITVDGEIRLDEVFEDPDPESTDTLHQYDGLYEIPLDAGRHTVVVENPGNDWCFVVYYLPWRKTEPILRVLGVQGDENGRLWVQNRQFTWKNANDPDFSPTPIEGARLDITHLAPGTWRWEQVDTRHGGKIVTGTHEVVHDTPLSLALPVITHDAAYRLQKLE